MAYEFGDLNVPVLQEDRINNYGLILKIRQAVKLGYQIIALNSFVEFDGRPSKKGGQRQEMQIPPPMQLHLNEVDKVSPKGQEVHILNRITLSVTEASQIHLLTSSSVTAYDIIAVQPKTEKLLQSLSSSVDVDIICFDLTDSGFLNVKKQQIRLAINHGIMFEIIYSPAIRDATARQHVFCKGKMITELCKGKNLILSSGSQKITEFRGPYDIVNLSLLFGLTEMQGKEALCTNIRSLLLHAEARKLGKGIVSVIPIRNLPKHEQWRVAATREDSTMESLEPSKKKKKKFL